MAVDAALGVVLEVELLDGMGFPAPPEEALGEALTHRVPVGLRVVEGRPLGKREALRGALAWVGLAGRAVPVTDAVRSLSQGSDVGLREASAGVAVVPLA
jgi:hypothetical protein